MGTLIAGVDCSTQATKVDNLWDILLIARPALVSCNVFEVREALLTLLRRAELAI